MKGVFDILPNNIIELIYSYDNTYHNIFKEVLNYIRSYDAIKLANNSKIYPFRILDRSYDESGFFFKTSSVDLDRYILNKFSLNTPMMTYYKLSWTHIPSRTWMIKLLSNSVGYSETFSIIEDFKDGDVFLMVFVNNIFYDITIKKVFICDNDLICPEYSDDYLTVKTNIYYETGPNKSVLKTMRLEYMNIHKHETFVT